MLVILTKGKTAFFYLLEYKIHNSVLKYSKLITSWPYHGFLAPPFAEPRNWLASENIQ